MGWARRLRAAWVAAFAAAALGVAALGEPEQAPECPSGDAEASDPRCEADWEPRWDDAPPKSVKARVLGVLRAGGVSVRCKRKIAEDVELAETYRLTAQFDRIHNRCPAKAKQGTDGSFRLLKTPQVRPELGETVGVVFAWLFHDETEMVTRTAELLMDPRLGFRARFAFHLDASAPATDHAALGAFAAQHPEVALVSESVDVEWGQLSFIDAQLRLMRDAAQAWDDWHTIVFLSGTDLVLGSRGRFREFFTRYAGYNFFGSSFKSNRADTPWALLLNDLITSCDNTTVSMGMRDMVLDPGELEKFGKVFMSNTQSFFSRAFVDYVLSGSDPNMDNLYKVLRFTTSVDEIFFPTVFFNSPHCRAYAGLRHDREFFTYFWPNHKLAQQEGANECRKALLQEPAWLCGLRPRWLKPEDAARLQFYPDTLFVRKASMRESGPLLDTVLGWHEADVREGLVPLGVNFRFRAGRTCLTLVSPDPPSFQWNAEGCTHSGSVLSAMCSGPVQLTATADGAFELRPEDEREGTLCTISPVLYPRNCLVTRGRDYEPDELVGLGLCSAFKEGQMFRFSRFPGAPVMLKHAAKLADLMYLRAGGLCLVKSSDGNANQLVLCSGLSPSDPRILSLAVVPDAPARQPAGGTTPPGAPHKLSSAKPTAPL